MKVIDVDSLPADPLEALRALSRADVELDASRRERVAAARPGESTESLRMTGPSRTAGDG